MVERVARARLTTWMDSMHMARHESAWKRRLLGVRVAC